MSKQREALELALEALEQYGTSSLNNEDAYSAAIKTIREALAEPEPEPVAWMCADEDMTRKGYSRFSRNCEGEWNIPVYTAPAARKPLTDSDVFNMAADYYEGYGFKALEFARAIERAHGIGDTE